MNMRRSKYFTGVLDVLISSITFSTLPILAKIAYKLGLSPESASILRFFFATVILALIIRLKGNKTVIIWSPWVILQGVFLAITNLLYFYSLKYLSAGIVTVMFFTYPVTVAILAAIFFKEKGTKRLIPSIILALLGVLLISSCNSFDGLSSYKYLFVALIATMSYSAFCLTGQKTAVNYDSMALTVTQCAIVLFAVFVLDCKHLDFVGTITAQQLFITFLMAIFGTWLAFEFLQKGIQHLGSTLASLISMIEPPATLLLAFLVLGEKMTLLQIIGTIMVLASVFIVVLPKESHNLNETEQIAA